MNYLLDVNVLVAWGWADHSEHERTVRWIASVRDDPSEGQLFTSAIPQLGFVRVSLQRSKGAVTVNQASEALAGMLSSLGDRHRFVGDLRPAIGFHSWCASASQTTDSHLAGLAEMHDATLASLDAGIPGIFLIPELSSKAGD